MAKLPPHMSTTEPVLSEPERIVLEASHKARWAKKKIVAHKADKTPRVPRLGRLMDTEYVNWLKGYSAAMEEIARFAKRMEED